MQTKLGARTRWCTLGRACLVAVAFAVQGAFGAVEIAGTVDLSATELSTTGLTRVHDERLDEDVVLCGECLVGSGTITNSSETMATLVIVEKGDARVNFAGRITGNIRVVLRNSGGEKWQAFTSDCNDYTGGTHFDGGFLYVSSYDALGTGDITLSNGGRLTYTGSTGVDAGYSGTYNTTLTNRIIVQGHGLLGAYADKHVTIASEISMPGARFEITNFGQMTFTRPFTAANVAGGTLDLGCAQMLAAPSVFGTTPDAVLPLNVRIRSGAEGASTLFLTKPGTLCVSNIVFAYSAGKCGGGIVGGGLPPQGERIGAIEDWATGAVVRVFGEFSVESGAVSNALEAISIENGVSVGRLSVANGATLAFSGSLSVPAGNGLVKTGAGTLALLGGCDVTGECRVEAGTLELGRNVRLPDTTTLRCGRGARVLLNDGAALTSPVLARDGGVVATADVWFDATALAGYADGDAVSRIPNLGTAGGAFEPSECEQAKRPGLPTYVRSGINGLPALNFDSGTWWPLGLCTKAYTNKMTTITVFHVLLFESWNSGRNKWCMPLASGPFGINNNDLWDTGKGFHYRFNDDNTPAAYQIRSNGINDRWELQGIWKGIGEPVLCATRRDGVNAYHVAYAADMKDRMRTISSYDAAAFNIEFLSLGAVMDSQGRVGFNGSGGRVFPGKIGEIIVFTRALSNEEIESVNAYLKAKWFGVSEDGATVYEAPAGQNVEVSVPADATAFLVPGFSVTNDTATGDWVKTGEGTLQVGGSAVHCASVAVEEGAVEIAPATAAGRATIWFDAADIASVAFNSDGTVSTVANKGSAGGLFTRASNTTSVATYVADGLNGRGCVQFDWHSGLSLDAWTSTNAAPRDIHVYGAFMRTDTQDTGTDGLGRFAGPFSFYHTSFTNEDVFTRGNFHWEERISHGMDTIAHWFGSDSWGMAALGADLHTGGNVWVVSNTVCGTGSVYLHVSHQQTHTFAFAYENAASDPTQLAIYATNAASVYLSPFHVNRTLLGGRMRDHGAAQDGANNRMWHGRIGEFIVLDRQPTRTEDAAILAYLRKKWLGKGTASDEPPPCLTGVGVLRESSSLALDFASGTRLVQAGPTVKLASLALADGVSVHRAASSTSPEAFKLFDVSGALSLTGRLSFACAPSPDRDVPVFSFGTCDDAATWTLDVPGHRQAHFATGASATWLRLANGTVILFR